MPSWSAPTHIDRSRYVWPRLGMVSARLTSSESVQRGNMYPPCSSKPASTGIFLSFPLPLSCSFMYGTSTLSLCVFLSSLLSVPANVSIFSPPFPLTCFPCYQPFLSLSQSVSFGLFLSLSVSLPLFISQSLSLPLFLTCFLLVPQPLPSLSSSDPTSLFLLRCGSSQTIDMITPAKETFPFSVSEYTMCTSIQRIPHSLISQVI